MLAPSDPVTVTVSALATPEVVAIKVAVVFPAATVTVEPNMTAASPPSLKLTAIPPAGGAWLTVTVPVIEAPPVTEAGGGKVTDTTEIGGSTVALPITEVPPAVAVTVTGVDTATELAVSAKVTELIPAGTTTVGGVGTGRAAELLLRFTVSPPGEAALPVRVTVPVVICPETTFAGLKESIETTGGFTFKGEGVEGTAAPPANAAETATVAAAATGNVGMVNVPLDLPAAITKLAGTVAAAGFEITLVSVTVIPAPWGAGPLSVTVPTGAGMPPPVIEPVLSVNDVIVGGLMVSVPLLMLVALNDAVTETGCALGGGTPKVVTGNVCEVLPPGIVNVGCTVRKDVLPLVNVRVIPPVGAAGLMVTVPIGAGLGVVPPMTEGMLKVTPVTFTLIGDTVT